jgi:hypothetical protein
MHTEDLLSYKSRRAIYPVEHDDNAFLITKETIGPITNSRPKEFKYAHPTPLCSHPTI